MSPNINLSSGAYEIRVTCVDNAENKSNLTCPFILPEENVLVFAANRYESEADAYRGYFGIAMKKYESLTNICDYCVYWLVMVNEGRETFVKNMFVQMLMPAAILDWKEVSSVGVRGIDSINGRQAINKLEDLTGATGAQYLSIQEVSPLGRAEFIFLGCVPKARTNSVGINIDGTAIIQSYGREDVVEIRRYVPL